VIKIRKQGTTIGFEYIEPTFLKNCINHLHKKEYNGINTYVSPMHLSEQLVKHLLFYIIENEC
jgi:hypothetical protein